MKSQDLDADIDTLEMVLKSKGVASVEDFSRFLTELRLARAVIRSACAMESANNANLDELADASSIFEAAEKFYTSLKNYNQQYPEI